MIAIRLELLARTYQAADHTLRAPEWPPHPDRLFQALVDGLHATGNSPDQRDVLQQLERVPWSVTASPASLRPPMIHYVPRNEEVPKSKNAYNPAVPTARTKERYLPASDPDHPVVHFHMLADVDTRLLDEMLSRVPRLGRSPVSAALATDAPAPSWIPEPSSGELRLRVPCPGRLQELEHAYETQSRAPLHWRGYRRAGTSTSAPDSGEFSMMPILACSGRGIDGLRAAPFVEHVRRVIMSMCDDPLPSWISGHAEDGAPLKGAHLAIAPIIFAGSYGDGRIMGLGLAIPSSVTPNEFTDRFQTILSKGLTINDQHWSAAHGRGQTTEPGTWNRPARTWVTVSPMEIRRREKRPPLEVATEWAHRSGFAEPVSASFRAEPFIGGPAHAARYAPGKRPRLRMHARVCFDQPISGPMILGMGRYRGFGLMRPIDDV